MGHPKPPCDLLILQEVTPAHKGLAPSGKFNPIDCLLKDICIFNLFIELSTGVLVLMLGTHKKTKPIVG